jgi:hypothetical protein
VIGMDMSISQEAHLLAADEARQDLGPNDAPPAPVTLRADALLEVVQVGAGLHPEHGEAVTYRPGEVVPDWVAALLAEQRPTPERDGQFTVYRLVNARKDEPPKGRRTPPREAT